MYFFLVFGIFFTITGLVCTVFPSASFGVLFFTALGIAMLGLTFCIKISTLNLKCSKFFKGVSVFGKCIFTIWLMSFVIIESLILFGTKSDENIEFDALIVLGAGINDDYPSLSFKARLDVAIAYLEENLDAIVVTTGGFGDDEKLSESYVAYKYLVDNGISKDRILIEEKSTNTYENILYAKEVLGEDFDGTACAVSNDFHLFRARELLKLFDFTPYAIGSKIPSYEGLNILYSIREYFSVVKHLIFER
ncbi:MAG: YdcF family protein [Clostridia bacterium]